MSKIKFLTIGYVEWRKGQDVLINAIEEMPKDVLEKCEFIIVGQDTSLMACDLKKRSGILPCVRFIGTVSREEIHELFGDAAALICPSREDPMPTVCAEAMMHSVPCIVSDATGTSNYLKDGHDGLIFKSEDYLDLMSKILWCVDNPDELTVMGKNAFDIYINEFSEKSFEANLLKYVEDILGKDEV